MRRDNRGVGGLMRREKEGSGKNEKQKEKNKKQGEMRLNFS